LVIGFQATSLVFPTPGCWEVTGRIGDKSLAFVIAVVIEAELTVLAVFW
jgi:hypothetical protein